MLSLIPRFSPWPVPRPIYDVGPGPVALLRGNYDHGWFGEVAASELITGEALAAKLGLTAGTPHNNATPWLKFAYQGKFLFMPKRPLRVDLSWNDILAVSAVYGDKVIQVGNHLFKVRLPKGALTDPAVVTQSNVQWGSEWDYTYGHVRGPTAYVSAANAFASYTIEDTLTTTAPDLAFYAMCMESMQVNTQHIKRQDVATYNVDTSKSWSRYDYGWRPVLEYVGSAVVGYDPNLWMQLRFKDNEVIEEVTETYVKLLGTATVSNEELNTTAASSSKMESHQILFESNEDFTVELEVYPISVGGEGGTLLGVWNTGGQSNNGWIIIMNADRTVAFALSANGTSYPMLYSEDVLPLNQWSHVAVVRKEGNIRMALRGTFQTTTQKNASATYRSTLPISTSLNNTNAWLNGKRRNMRISTKAKYTENFVPATILPEYVRPAYSVEDAAAIVLQLPLRRESVQDEANPNSLSLFAATVANSRITTTSSTGSYFSIASRAFGAGDFTIEMSIRPTSVHATFGACLVGQWFSAGNASDSNRWGLILYPNRSIGFIMARSANASDSVSTVSSAAAVTLGVDSHIVVERVNGRLILYVNGVEVASTLSLDFPIRGAAPYVVRSLSAANVYTYAGQMWNLRIADKAMYNGAIPKHINFPAMPGPIQPILQVAGNSLPVGTTNVGCTLTENGISVPVGGYLSIPGDPKYTFARGDFTIDAVLTVRSTVQGTGAGSANALTTLIFWGTWGAVGQPLNFELIYNHTTGALGLNTSWTDATQNAGVNYTLPIGQKVNIRCVRKRSVLYIYADNQLLRQVAHPVNIGYDTPQPLLIGRRKGGGSGEVSWYCDMLLESLTITKEALMP